MKGFLVALLAGISSVGAQKCYNPDGSDLIGYAYQPCNQVTGSFSQCCGTNHTGSVSPDVCLPNGLCRNTGDNNIWRQGCTDPTFKSPYCLNICGDGVVGGSSSENVPMHKCSGNTWCCSLNLSGDCCKTSSLVFALAATIGVATSTSSGSTTTSATTTGTSVSSTVAATTSDGSPAQTSPADPNISAVPSGLSSGAKIGLGVGIALGVVVLAAVLGFCLYRRKKNRKDFQAVRQHDESPGPNVPGKDGTYFGTGVNEKAGVANQSHEMDAVKPAAEMEDAEAQRKAREGRVYEMQA